MAVKWKTTYCSDGFEQLLFIHHQDTKQICYWFCLVLLMRVWHLQPKMCNFLVFIVAASVCFVTISCFFSQLKDNSADLAHLQTRQHLFQNPLRLLNNKTTVTESSKNCFQTSRMWNIFTVHTRCVNSVHLQQTHTLATSPCVSHAFVGVCAHVR